MKRVLLSVLMVTVLLTLAGCGEEVKIGMALSEKQRVASPHVATSDLTDLVDGNSAFAFELYKALSAEDGNVFYSPYSISLALAMTVASWSGT